MTTPNFGNQPRAHQVRTVIGAALLAATFGACKASDLNITNPNSATVEGASADPSALQLLATGLLADFRSTRGGLMSTPGILGRESYSFSPQEGRNTTHPLIGIVVGGVQKLDPTGFSTGIWGGEYGTLRDIFNFKNTVNNSTTLNAAQKAAALGLAQTIEATMLLHIVSAHDTLGAITEIKENAADLAPFVSRDSVYKFILGTYDAAATTRAAFDVGVYHTYGVSPDSPNGFAVATNTNLYAHMSIQTDAQLKANGQPDDRYAAKVRTGLPARTGPGR